MTATPVSEPFSPSLERIAAALDHSLFSSGDPTVVALRGGWGEGKTHFWKKTVAAGRADEKPGYVSVFGAESLAAIQREVVVEAIRARPKSTTGETLQKAIEGMYPFLQATKGVLNAIGGTFGFTTEAFSVPPELLQRVVLRPGWVVCLDDIERLPSNIELDALFGYISVLRDEYKLNVLLIYNEKKITGQRSDYLERYVEKAVDRDIAFAPTNREIIDLVFKDAFTEATLVQLAEKCEILGLRNIRVLGRVRRYYEDVVRALPMSVEPEYLPNILSSLLLFCWCKFERVDARDLTLEFLEQYQGYWENADRSNEKDKDWRQLLLSKFRYSLSDDLDRILIRFVGSSLLDSEGMLRHHESFLVERKRKRAGERLNRAWDHFHNTFKDREVEFGNEIYAAVRDDMESIPISQIDSVMVQLDKMGRKGDASALLEQLKTTYPERLAKYDDSVSRLEYGPLNNVVAEAKQRATADERSIKATIESALADEELIQLRNRQRLAQFSAQQFYDYFSSTEMRGLTGILRKLVKLTSVGGADEYDVAANKNLRIAAQMLADTSRLNRDRIAAMGLLEEAVRDKSGGD